MVWEVKRAWANKLEGGKNDPGILIWFFGKKGGVMIWRNHEGGFWGAADVLYFDLSAVYMGGLSLFMFAILAT